MSSGFVVETSVLTRNHIPAIQARLKSLPGEQLARCSITDLELGFSARNVMEWQRVARMLTKFQEIHITPDVIRRAKRVQRALAEQSLRGRKVPDLLIAAAAELNSFTVLHYDQDFELISKVTGQPHEWVVPRGSVD